MQWIYKNMVIWHWLIDIWWGSRQGCIQFLDKRKRIHSAEMRWLPSPFIYVAGIPVTLICMQQDIPMFGIAMVIRVDSDVSVWLKAWVRCLCTPPPPPPPGAHMGNIGEENFYEHPAADFANHELWRWRWLLCSAFHKKTLSSGFLWSAATSYCEDLDSHASPRKASKWGQPLKVTVRSRIFLFSKKECTLMEVILFSEVFYQRKKHEFAITKMNKE